MSLVSGAPPARSLYIHVPFCTHKCHYCDFYSIVDPFGRQEAFTARLVRELRALAPGAGGLPLRTVFAGGGTPSLLEPRLWRVILDTLAASYDLGPINRAEPGTEFTVECNPETVTPELIDTLAAGGVGRVSLGAQSFDPRHLKTLERRHDPDSVPRALEIARAGGIRRTSIDLIFAVPGQTPEQWAADLDRALALGTEHLSCYNLTYEPRTAMTARLERGEFQPLDEDDEVSMLELTLERTMAAGLHRYEVSNFARPGAESRHNLAYWRQEPWLAAGPSASAHVGGHRWKNLPRLDDYLSIDDEGFAPITDHEPPDASRALAERIMTGLRLREGIEAALLLADAGETDPGCAERLVRAADTLESRGWLERGDGRWRLSASGFLFADGAAAELMRAVV